MDLQHAWTFEAIGTQWQIDLYDQVEDIATVKMSLASRIAEFDQFFSRFREDSAVSIMAKRPGQYALPSFAHTLLSFYKHMYDITEGKFTPMIGSLLEEAGYDASYSLTSSALHQPLSWEKGIEVRADSISALSPVLLDVGAAGKGYLIDLLADLLREQGCSDFCIDGSGDLYLNTSTGRQLNIGLEDPQDISKAVGIAKMSHGISLCASAGNRRQWGQYHHIIDPQLLKSPQHILATWVMADSAMLADGISTALFLVDAKQLADFDFHYAILYADYGLAYSKGFPAEWFM